MLPRFANNAENGVLEYDTSSGLTGAASTFGDKTWRFFLLITHTKTDRFNMSLLQLTGITGLHTSFNVHGLGPVEGRNGGILPMGP